MRQLVINPSVTNRDNRTLDKYLHDISGYELLTPEEEVELAQKIKNGATPEERREALERMTRANLRFVVSVAKQYMNQGLSLPDLISEGNKGLIKAAERFDETRGFKFISYAVWWIRQSILQSITENGRTVRLPSNQHALLNRIRREQARFEQEHERKPTSEELSELVDTPVDKINSLLGVAARSISLDEPSNDDGDTAIIDNLADTHSESTDHGLMLESLSNDIERALSSLTEYEREIIKMYYGIGRLQPLSLDEIASHFNLTRERVRQIKERGINRLKNSSKAKILQSYL